MKRDEEEHAEKIEQTLASIDKNLERIAKSLEKMEPPVYQLPKFDIPVDASDVKEVVSKFGKPRWIHDCGTTYLEWSNPDGNSVKDPAAVDNPAAGGEKTSEPKMPDYWRDCLSDTFKP